MTTSASATSSLDHVGAPSGGASAPTTVPAASRLDGSLLSTDVYDTRDCIKIE